MRVREKLKRKLNNLRRRVKFLTGGNAMVHYWNICNGTKMKHAYSWRYYNSMGLLVVERSTESGRAQNAHSINF